MDLLNWNRGLSLAALLVSLGAMALVSARSVRDRMFAFGILTQGVVIAFAVSGAYHQRNELAAVAIALILVSVLWCFWILNFSSQGVVDPAVENSNSTESVRTSGRTSSEQPNSVPDSSTQCELPKGTA